MLTSLFLLQGLLGTVRSDAEATSPQATLRMRVLEGLGAGTPIATLWLLYYPALSAWWLHDDPFILESLFKHGALPHVYDPAIWRQFTSAFFTPWVQFSLGLDLHVFGLEPEGFYLHHLLAFSIIAVVLYRTARLFFAPFPASLAVSLFVVSVPSATVAQLLMTRHYLEGLGLSLLAFALYHRSVQMGTTKHAALGAFCYLLACLAKEVYVPLVALVCFYPTASWKQRLRTAAPFLVVAALYVGWRAYMLGPAYILAGYGDVHGRPTWNDLLHTPLQLARLMGWQAPWSLGLHLSGLLLGLLVLLRRSSPARWLFAAVLLVCALAPLGPVLPILTPRYLFAAWTVGCLVLAAGIGYVYHSRYSYLAYVLALPLLSFAVISASTAPLWKNRAVVDRYRAEGTFILNGTSTDLLMDPAGPPWYYESLGWIREHVQNQTAGPHACYDVCVCDTAGIQRRWHYSPQATRLVPERPVDFSPAPPTCGDSTAALSVALTYANDALRWQLGPYEIGQFYISMEDDSVLNGYFRAIPPKGQFQAMMTEPVELVVRYVAPEGWQTYSPVLPFDPTQQDPHGHSTLRWQRP